MVTTIVPAVFAGRREKWVVVAAVFTLASVLGGALTGAAFGLVGVYLSRMVPALFDHAAVVLAAMALAYALYELELIRLPTLPIRRQVPSQLRGRLPLTLVALVYGGQLGAGILTRINTSTLYIVCVGILVTSNPVLGAFVMGCYGLARAVFNMAMSASLQSMDAAIARSRDLMQWQPTIHVVAAFSLLATAVVFGLQTLLRPW